MSSEIDLKTIELVMLKIVVKFDLTFFHQATLSNNQM